MPPRDATRVMAVDPRGVGTSSERSGREKGKLHIAGSPWVCHRVASAQKVDGPP